MEDDGKVNISLDKKLIRTSILVFFMLIGSAAYLGTGWKDSAVEATEFSKAVPVVIEDIYPLFMCPCCSKPLDPEQPCCDLAKERIDYISALHDAGISNQEIVLTTVRKYGTDLLIDDSMKDKVMAELARRAPKDRPKIIIEPTFYDFGEVSFAGGIVKTTMAIKNTGGSALVINDMDTSCGCTSATITKDGVEGPIFRMKMHGTNPVGWSETLKPGETALLNIYYDPAVHPELRGAVTRIVSIYSNDPVDFKKDVRIDVVQVD